VTIKVPDPSDLYQDDERALKDYELMDKYE
jgi:hypothetical protein